MNAHRSSTYRPVRDAIALALIVALTWGLAILAAGRAHAAAATRANAPTTAQVAQLACQEFAAWRRHETVANLRRLVITSAGLPRSYFRADIGQLYADASSLSLKSGKYVQADSKYVSEDCA